MSFYVDTQNTGLVNDEKIQKALKNLIDLTPKGIRNI